MDLGDRRSTDVTETLTMALPEQEAPSRFDDLYRACRDDVFAYVATLLRDRASAEDVTAKAFERAYRRRRLFDARRGSERAWLFGIARNAALDELRRRKRVATVEEDQIVGSEPDPGDATVRRQTVEAAMSGLDPRERELVSLKYFAGLGNAEIAAVLGTSETNAGTRVHRAVSKLREACNAPS